MEEKPLTLTRKEAAQCLNISESYLDLITKRGEIAVCKLGRRKLYRLKALEDYLKECETTQKDAGIDPCGPSQTAPYS